MADSGNFGFGKFVPGFDFLQNLAKGASQGMPQMPNLSSWIAPTLNVEDLQKRIDELKTVQFWLEQNSKAIGATVQALEVQKMTLSTLKGMNFSMGELAGALQLKPEAAARSALSPVSPVAAVPSAAAVEADPPPAKKRVRRKPADSKTQGKSGDASASSAATGVVDPMQWWGALSQQFQQIASDAMKDAARQTAADATRPTATGTARAGGAAKRKAGTAAAGASGKRRRA